MFVLVDGWWLCWVIVVSGLDGSVVFVLSFVVFGGFALLASGRYCALPILSVVVVSLVCA